MIFLHLKAEFHCCYVLALFLNFIVVAAMLHIMPKLHVILRLKHVNTWELLHSPGKEIKVIAILSLKNLFQPAITRPDFEEFSMLATNNIYFEVALTLQRPKFPSYRSQLVDLQSKSTDFLYIVGILVVKGLMESLLSNRDHPPLNKNNQFSTLEFFDNLGMAFHHMRSCKIDLFVAHSF